eukprot:5202320-Alexandrium_andersonii.AAC.1
MPNLSTKWAGKRAGGARQGGPGGRAPPGGPVLRNGTSIEPNRSTDPHTMETEPTEPSTFLSTSGGGRG